MWKELKITVYHLQITTQNQPAYTRHTGLCQILWIFFLEIENLPKYKSAKRSTRKKRQNLLPSNLSVLQYLLFVVQVWVISVC